MVSSKLEILQFVAEIFENLKSEIFETYKFDGFYWK